MQNTPPLPRRLTPLLIPFAALLLATACTGIPKGVEPVRGFEADRYLGKWYEIARLDHRFERGLMYVTAEYERNPNGTIAVTNRGFDFVDQEWSTATATAEFLEDETTASLKVTFQWPFSGGYHVIALDQEDYRWAMVSGPSRDYLWVLSRTPVLDQQILTALLESAEDGGYPVEEIIYVPQEPPPYEEAAIRANER